ncbi:hypothetical protein KGY73_10690 [bacterium]|nr:hypothetical protein [bacterium]
MEMIQEDLLVKLVDRIHTLHIPYMMTGGIAAIFYGKPRLTHDFDLIIEMDFHRIPELVNEFKNDFYIDKEAVQQAVQHQKMFNLIHFDSGIKVDFWMVKDEEFDKTRFERRQEHTYKGRKVYFTTPEDIILIKLVWFKNSQIHKHREDAVGILEVQKGLDEGYLKKWAERLSVKKLLREIQ